MWCRKATVTLQYGGTHTTDTLPTAPMATRELQRRSTKRLPTKMDKKSRGSDVMTCREVLAPPTLANPSCLTQRTYMVCLTFLKVVVLQSGRD